MTSLDEVRLNGEVKTMQGMIGSLPAGEYQILLIEI